MLFLFIYAITATILVYNGDGVSSKCLEYTINTFHQLTGLTVQPVSAKELTNSNWESNCKALVIPGGRDFPYKRDLEPLVTTRIRKWVVEQGGAYIGICAGAYFACQSISFEEGTNLEIIGDRDLALFRGVAKGCIYPYPQAHILTLGNNIECYYMGGPYFVGDSDFEVLLRYSENGEAAVVFGQRGKGRVLLMGVHLEVDHLLEGLPLGKRIMGWRSQDDRLSLLRQLLKRVLN